jgi:hypothetical protein
MPTINHLLVGTNHRGPEAEAFVPQMQPGHEVRLVRDPENKFDRYAIRVHALIPAEERVLDVGFLAKGKNAALARWMDATGNTTMAGVRLRRHGTIEGARRQRHHPRRVNVTTPDEE